MMKAEFDSLKNTFQTQIDGFNKNIDNKIDGAINSYLAGIKASKESRLDGNIDILSYPLRLVNYHKGLYRLDSPRRERSTPFYSPGYLFYGGLHRAKNNNTEGNGDGMLAISLLDIAPVSEEKSWLNGTWNSAGTKFTTTGMSGGINYIFTGAVYYDGDHDISSGGAGNAWAESGGEGGFLCCDYKSVGTSEWGSIPNGNTRTGSGYTLYSDYDVITNTREVLRINLIPGIISANSTISWNYTSSQNLDYWRFSPSDKRLWLNRCASEDKLKSYQYSPAKSDKLSIIFNNGLYYDSTQASLNNTEYKKYLAPVTFGDTQTIYLTNMKKYRQALTQATSNSGWWRMYTLQSSNIYTALSVITTGLNIESAYSTSPTTGTYKHELTKRSAVKTKDIYYNFKDVNGDIIEHHMVDGLPLVSLPAKYRNNVSKITIKFNMTSQDSANTKYAIFSERPIGVHKFDENVEGLDTIIPISKVNGVPNTTKKIVLQEGDNEIEIERMSGPNVVFEGGNVVYMKVLWDDHVTELTSSEVFGEQYVTINDVPKFVVKEIGG